MMLRRLTLLAASAILLAAATSCTDDDVGEANAIVERIPWGASEAYTYDLVDDDGDNVGEGTLAITERDGQSIIIQRFSDDEGNADRAVTAVDAETLLPSAGERVIVDALDDRLVILDTEYGELDDGSYGVRIRERNYSPDDDEELEALPTSNDPNSERCNPLKLPDNAYDNDSSLFLWRTIEFAEGNEVTYTASLPNRRLRREVTLTVVEQTRVETPAGEFDAWRVRIQSEGQDHDAWFATTDDHKLLVYDNDQQVFLYTGETEVPEFTAPRGVSEQCE